MNESIFVPPIAPCGHIVSTASESPRLAGPSSLDLSVATIILTVGLIVGTIFHRGNLFYTVNDASRIDTVYYLVQHGTYEFLPDTTINWANRPQPGVPRADDPGTIPVLWTIDMIQANGKLYSSKPPMYSTCLAGIVWGAQKLSGLTMHDYPLAMIRTMLIVGQVLPLAVALLLLRRNIFRLTDSPFARDFTMLAACLGTYLTPWSITINNHVPAAATGMIALDAAIRIWYEHRREWYWFMLAGFFAALTATIELPAALLAVTLFVALLIKDARRTLIFGLVAALLPTTVALYTNHLVTGQLMPAYESWDKEANKPNSFYSYKGSYWNQRRGIDAINEPWPVYLTHTLVGHGGFFSLTPLFLISLLGIGIAASRADGPRLLAGAALAITAAVVCTYVLRTRNYGGGCQGFRWLFWVVPMWLLFLPPGVEYMSRTVLRRLGLYACLAVSVFSVGFALDHPWSSTWIRVLFNQWGWIEY